MNLFWYFLIINNIDLKPYIIYLTIYEIMFGIFIFEDILIYSVIWICKYSRINEINYLRYVL